jgi:hypothetical protein
MTESSPGAPASISGPNCGRAESGLNITDQRSARHRLCGRRRLTSPSACADSTRQGRASTRPDGSPLTVRGAAAGPSSDRCRPRVPAPRRSTRQMLGRWAVPPRSRRSRRVCRSPASTDRPGLRGAFPGDAPDGGGPCAIHRVLPRPLTPLCLELFEPDALTLLGGRVSASIMTPGRQSSSTWRFPSPHDDCRFDRV